VVPDVDALNAALQQFVTAGAQRTLGTLVARIHSNFSRQFGMDVLDSRALAAAGLNPAGGLAVMHATAHTHPFAVVALQDATALRKHMVQKVAGPYVKALLADESIGNAVLTTLRLSPEGGPRITWAIEGARVYLAGPGSDAALRTFLLAHKPASLAPDERLRQMAQELGPAQGFGVRAGSPQAAKPYHVVGLHADATGWVLQAQIAEPHWHQRLCQAPHSATAHSTAMSLGHALEAGALGMAYGSSTTGLAALMAPAHRIGETQARALLGSKGSEILMRGQAYLPPLIATLAALGSPWAWAGFGNGAPRQDPVHPRDLLGAALVVQAQTPADKARLRTLAQDLQHGVRLPGLPRGDLAKVTLQGATGPSLSPKVAGSGWAVAVVHDTLIATYGKGRLTPILSRLNEPAKTLQPSQEAGTAPAQVALFGTGHLGAASSLAQDVIAAGAQGPLQGTAWEHMPGLLMLGPTGDALREVGALGDLSVQLVCTPTGIMATVIDRLAAP
jgi:hypothetical protein